MMKLNVVLALVALFTAQALCSESRALLKDAFAATKTDLKAKDAYVGANGLAVSKEGKAIAVMKGFAVAEEKVYNDFIYFFKVVLDKYYLKKVCKKDPFKKGCCPYAAAYIEEELKLKAAAIAKTYSEVTVKVYVNGKGQACGAADAYADAKAVAFLKACVKAVVAAKVGYSYDKAYSIIIGYKYLVAKAFSSAWAKACVTEGVAATYQKAFALAIAKACVKIVLDMAAYEGCTFEETYNDSYVKEKDAEKTVAGAGGKSFIDGDGVIDAGSKAGAGTKIFGGFKEKHEIFDKDFY